MEEHTKCVNEDGESLDDCWGVMTRRSNRIRSPPVTYQPYCHYKHIPQGNIGFPLRVRIHRRLGGPQDAVTPYSIASSSI
jgi:hypothetical protein